MAPGEAGEKGDAGGGEVPDRFGEDDGFFCRDEHSVDDRAGFWKEMVERRLHDDEIGGGKRGGLGEVGELGGCTESIDRIDEAGVDIDPMIPDPPRAEMTPV